MLWAGVQSPALIKNRQLGLPAIILSFGKHAQPFLFTSHIQLQSHTGTKAKQPHSHRYIVIEDHAVYCLLAAFD